MLRMPESRIVDIFFLAGFVISKNRSAREHENESMGRVREVSSLSCWCCQSAREKCHSLSFSFFCLGEFGVFALGTGASQHEGRK